MFGFTTQIYNNDKCKIKMPTFLEYKCLKNNLYISVMVYDTIIDSLLTYYTIPVRVTYIFI